MKKLNCEIEVNSIKKFIKNEVKAAGFSKILVGLSGGIDSSVTAALSVLSVGKENVIGVMMPYKKSHTASLQDAITLAKYLGIEYKIIDISPMADAYFDIYEDKADKLRRGNRLARERMCVLFDLSAKYRALVAGTGNRSELLIGYCTQYGDNACAFEPIGHLYKTEVKELAKYLKIPASIIKKVPTADLWENQTDEEEMGISYEMLDEILSKYFDLNMSIQEIMDSGFSGEEIEKVIQMNRKSEYKRRIPNMIETSIKQF